MMGTRRLCLASLFLALWGTRRAAAQGGSVPPEAKALVTKVVSSFGEGRVPEFGAGIVIGVARGELYVATARHVVVVRDTARSIWVVFSSRDSLPAKMVMGRNTNIDLAVLRISGDPARLMQVTPRSWDRLGNVRSLRSDDPVSPVGCPQAVCWQAPTPPDRIVGIDRLGVLFQSSFVQKGSSGGALFNEWWEVVGMVTEDEPPRANAIRIDELLAQARAWGVPVTLRRASVPRAGYRTTIGAVILTPTSSSGAGATQSAMPSGRVTIVRQVLPAVGWHVAATRLTPQNLVVTAATAGAGLHLRKGRFALHPFVEAGFGQVEGRFDAGGYYVAVAGGTRYVPFWSRVVGDGLGVGAGTTLDVMVVPRTMLELSAAYWSFTAPIGAPKLNDVFIGGGVRVGI